MRLCFREELLTRRENFLTISHNVKINLSRYIARTVILSVCTSSLAAFMDNTQCAQLFILPVFFTLKITLISRDTAKKFLQDFYTHELHRDCVTSLYNPNGRPNDATRVNRQISDLSSLLSFK